MTTIPTRTTTTPPARPHYNYILTCQLHTHIHRIHRTGTLPHLTACGVHVYGANEPHYAPPPDTPTCLRCWHTNGQRHALAQPKYTYTY